MNILKFFPADPFLVLSDEAIEAAERAITELFPGHDVEDGASPRPQFVDCGDSLERVVCPLCGEEIDSEDWSCMMDALFGEYGFDALGVILPCCGGRSSLDRLIYSAPCGFSCYEIDVWDASCCPEGALEKLSSASGTPFKCIAAHI